MQKKGRWDDTSNEAHGIRWTVLQMSNTRPPQQGMPRPSGLLNMQRDSPSTMGLSTRYMRGEQTEESHHRSCRAEDPPRDKGTTKKRKGRQKLLDALSWGVSLGKSSEAPPSWRSYGKGSGRSFRRVMGRDVRARKWQFLHLRAHNGIIFIDQGIDTNN